MAYEQADQDRRLYLTMAIISTAIIFAGFAPSFYLKSILHAPPPLSPLTILHGVVYSVGYSSPARHRQLGVLGAVLFGAVVCVGMSTAITAGKLGHAPPGAPEPLVFMALPVIAIAVLCLIVLFALGYRARSDVHRRLMLASYFMMTAPALHRIAIGAGQIPAGLWVSLLGPDLLLLAAIAWDFRANRRLHPAYGWSLAAFAFQNAAVLWAFSSPAWLPIATWLTQG
jgi:hypothetical protein